MEITEVRITVREEKQLKGFANVTFDDVFVVRGMKIIQGHDKLFVSMPNKKRPDNTYQDIAHPVSTEMRQMIESKVIEAYYIELEEVNVKTG